MLKKYMKDKETMASIAGGRSDIYGLLVGIFALLPDAKLLQMIKGPAMRDMLDLYFCMEDPRFTTGLDLIKSYQSELESRDDEEVLEELSVDRTRLLRAPGMADLWLPYEGLYKKGKNARGGTPLKVKTFYRQAGIVPDDGAGDPPDFLCIELDFMSRLCRREQEEWRSNGNAIETVATEKRFLDEHLGTWVGDYCAMAEKVAVTGFYHGFILILAAIVSCDIKYLADLTKTKR